MKRIITLLFFIVATLNIAEAGSMEACFKNAAKKHNVPMPILLAVSYTESRFKKNAKNHNRNGTRDYGLMQINSIWAKTAGKMGYSWSQVKKNGCTNIMFGSHILKSNYKRLGSWKAAIGAYNAGFAKTPKARKRRQHYYNLVMRHRQIAKKTFKKFKKQKA